MPHTMLRLPTVKARTGLSRSTIYLRISRGTFPAPVSLGGRAVGWIEAEVMIVNPMGLLITYLRGDRALVTR